MKRIGVKCFLGAVLVLSLILILVTFCTPFSALTKEWEWPDALRASTPGIGSSGYMAAAAWSPVMSEKTGMKVRLIPEDSLPIKLRWLKLQITDIMFDAMSSVGPFGMEARGPYATRTGGPFQIRMVWPAQVLSFGFAVRGDSKIKTIHDIKPEKKIRIATVPPIPVLNAGIYGLLAWLQLDKKDVVLVPFNSYPASMRALPEGKVDVVYAAPSSSVMYEADSGPKGLRWLELPAKKEPEGAKRFVKVRGPTLWGPVKGGVKSSIGVDMVVSPHMQFVRADASSEFIYHYSKWLGENFAVYKQKHRNCELMSPEAFRVVLDNTFLPIHEGTIRYLKEVGMWSASDDVRQEKNIKLLTRYVKAYEAAIAEAVKKKIKIKPKDEKWMDLWASYKKDLPGFGIED